MAWSMVAAGCQPQASPPPASGPATRTLSPDVRDPAGLATAFKVVAADHLALSAGVLVPSGDPTDALLEWRGLACEVSPTITLSGMLPDGVAIRVDRGPITESTCLDTSAGWAIQLTFREPIDTASTDVQVFAGRPDAP